MGYSRPMGRVAARVLTVFALLILVLPATYGASQERRLPSNPGTLAALDTWQSVALRGKVRMSPPFMKRGHIKAADAFSSPEGASSAPWGNPHDGIDLFTKKDKAPFVAVFPGNVVFVTTIKGQFGDAVNVLVEFDGVFQAEYGFEPQKKGKAALDTQLGFIRVVAGERVRRGQIIGYLHRPNDMSHVHFGFHENSTQICPEPFFKKNAARKIMRILRKTWDRAVQMCY